MAISIVDKPVKASLERLADADTLETSKYAASLAKFISGCETPLTIGVQGEWGSGKTSLLNMICEYIEAGEITYKKDEKHAKPKTVRGSEYFKTIWIDTWEHSLLKTPEGCLISIVEEIIDEIAKVDGRYDVAQKAKSALGALARGAVRISASYALGAHAGQVADEAMSSSSSNCVKDLRRSLERIVGGIWHSENNDTKRFVIFVDDLDRLEPSVAVQVLELLKNIFNIDHCVFVLAIDYQVVVKGLKGKFGEPNESNEWEFRAFFDKIIQVPFMMPVAQYNLGKFIIKSLADDIGYFVKDEAELLKGDGRLGEIVRYTIGHNPRSMKRLLNSVSLIRIQNETELTEKESFRLRQIIFALVCIQISFPKIYELLLLSPDFSQWGDDNEFVGRVTGGEYLENSEMKKALNTALEVNKDDFDEDWEAALFKIVWCKKWQRNRLVDTSRVLSVIKDTILANTDAKKFEALMIEGLKMTAVTAVSSTDDTVVVQRSEGNANDRQLRANYWRQLSDAAKGTESVFESTKEMPIKETHTTHYLVRRPPDSLVSFVAFTGSTTPLKIEAQYGCDLDEYKQYMINLSKHKAKIEEIVGTSCSFKLGEEPGKQHISFDPPPGVGRRIRLEHDEKARAAVIKWLVATARPLEEFLESVSSDAAILEEAVEGT